MWPSAPTFMEAIGILELGPRGAVVGLRGILPENLLPEWTMYSDNLLIAGLGLCAKQNPRPPCLRFAAVTPPFGQVCRKTEVDEHGIRRTKSCHAAVIAVAS